MHYPVFVVRLISRFDQELITAVLSMDKPNLRLDNKKPAEEGNSTCGGNK
jgi:hypothetical protein